MAEAGEDSNKDVWGTWEELLLVYAVDRHGTKNWDSVAMEIQNRITSSSSPNFLLTPNNCKQKYLNLRRRFKDNFKNESEIDNKLDDNTIPWLQELRKLRVAELRREVHQKDVKIVSLELKVKRLTEERERSSNEKENGGEVKLDLERLRPEPEENGISEPVNCSSSPDKPISGEDSDRENQSFNESNSTDPKQENRVTDVDESDKNKKIESDEIVAGEQDPVKNDSPEDKPAGEGSYNGSSETILKDSVSKAFEKSSEAIPETEPGESPFESVTDSKERETEAEGEAEGTKENSDVQSSASLSKENRRKKDTSVSSSGEEPETDEISPAIKRISVKSHPLAKVLEIIKSHKYGYVFERRLESQETSKYKSLIRQHLDLEIINKRFKAGHYSGCSRKFFRDMLLLINNAIIFFPNNSVEVLAAMELRQLIQKEIGSRMRKANKSVASQPPRVVTVTVSPPPLPKTDPEPSSSLLAKAKSSVPIIACRKRSSISSKGPNGSGERKAEKKEAVVEEKKPIVDRKQDNRVGNFVQEQIVIKKGKRDRPTSGARSSRPVGKNHINNNPNKQPSSSPNQNPNPSANPSSSSKGGTPTDDVSEKGDKEKKGNVNTVSKKRSVANFLDRMQKNNSSNGTLVDSLKNSGNNSNNNNKGENRGETKGGNAEQKKNSSGKGESRKEQATKQSSSKKHSRDKGSPPKRSVGRPPKRNASSSSPATPPPPSKRSRETAEMEEAASKQPRKRSRR